MARLKRPRSSSEDEEGDGTGWDGRAVATAAADPPPALTSVARSLASYGLPVILGTMGAAGSVDATATADDLGGEMLAHYL